jgi:hypothetical protein
METPVCERYEMDFGFTKPSNVSKDILYIVILKSLKTLETVELKGPFESRDDALDYKKQLDELPHVYQNLSAEVFPLSLDLEVE